jgi:hypothetical protein
LQNIIDGDDLEKHIIFLETKLKELHKAGNRKAVASTEADLHKMQKKERRLADHALSSA